MTHHDNMRSQWDIPRSALEGVFAISISLDHETSYPPVEFMQVLDLPHFLDVYLWILRYLFNMTA